MGFASGAACGARERSESELRASAGGGCGPRDSASRNDCFYFPKILLNHEPFFAAARSASSSAALRLATISGSYIIPVQRHLVMLVRCSTS